MISLLVSSGIFDVSMVLIFLKDIFVSRVDRK